VKDVLTGWRPPPLELLPWLMMVVLAVESLLANRFYRRAAPDTEAVAKASEPGAQAAGASLRSLTSRFQASLSEGDEMNEQA
jgi:hypothetical protein